MCATSASNLPLLIDTHCHPAGDVTDEAMLAEAEALGVRVLLVGGNAAMNRAAAVSGRCFAQGIDWSAEEPWDGTFEPDPGICAVGELGFDFHYASGPETEALQRTRFAVQTTVAKARGLPIIVHTREADDVTLDALRGADLPATGVIHSFTGDIPFARKLLDLGYWISLSGIVTFRNADRLREVAKFLPDDRILVETDTPYLAPVPMRGRPNRPAYVRHTAEAIAKLRGVPLETFAALTTANATRCFRRPDGFKSGMEVRS